MSGVAGLPWGADQQRMLVAMGHELFRLSSSGSSPSAVSAGATATDARPVKEAAAAGEAVQHRRDRLWAALRQAAGGQDVAALVADIEVLRRDPALKRALWPRLRALLRAAGARNRGEGPGHGHERAT